MPILTAHEMAGYWVMVGGPAKKALAWISVSLSESSWNTEAVSPTDARGLYQVEPYSWPAGAGPLDAWDEPGVNSLAAVLLSGGGVNFAPWDTAYADIERSGRYTFLSWPEEGSAAANNMAYVAGLLGTTTYGGTQPTVTPGVTDTLPAALKWYGQATNSVIPLLTDSAKRFTGIARSMY